MTLALVEAGRNIKNAVELNPQLFLFRNQLVYKDDRQI